ncbi:MAG: DUF5012 domain-containing protein [Tannerellaceae bacterium]|nr:DUF5012 domain-containing protein [Tannerellaceae bacterium]
MRNKLFTIIICALSVFILGSCSDSTEGYTRITYYPSLTLEGDQYIYLHLNDTYVEPGYEAELNGEDVSDEVVIKSNLNTGTSGFYTIEYSIMNEDGFSMEATRYVIVTDPTDAVEGVYYTDPDSYRLYNGITPYGDSYMILVFSNGDGTYSVEDLLGGWYAQRSGYGTDYAMQGVISVSGGNVTMLDSYVPGWGDEADSMTNGNFDEATGTLSWTITYTDTPLVFYVIMHKQ